MTDEPNARPSSPEPDRNGASPARLQEMRLHPDRPTVTRLSRKVLLGLGGVAAVAIAGTLFFAFKPHPQTGVTEPINTANRTTPQGLTNLPRDYAGLPRTAPKLGPPLPGDLGRPILNAGAPAPGMPTPGAGTAEQQHLAQEQDAARTSHLFATTNTSQSITAVLPANMPPVTPTAASAASAPADAGVSDHKFAFLSGNADRQTQSPDRVEATPSPNVLQAGAVIPAALITGLRSDLPGEITAQVTQNIFDSPTGRILLIPQGARLIGKYDAQIAFGQSRALLVWNRLIMPNGRSIVLERQPGTDTQGYAGLEDEVDNHWGMLFKAAILSTLLSVGSEAGISNSESNLAQAIRQGASQSFGQVGQQVVGRSLNVQPTITIRPGFPVNVLVTHDLILEPYRS